MRAQRQLVRLRAIAGELGAHEFERRHLQVELVGVVLVDDGDPRLRVALDLTHTRLQLRRLGVTGQPLWVSGKRGMDDHAAGSGGAATQGGSHPGV